MANIEKAGRIVARSKNLRGVLDYGRRWGVARLELIELPEGAGSLRVIFKDGATTRENFASWGVLRAWVNARRSWAGAALFVNGQKAKTA